MAGPIPNQANFGSFVPTTNVWEMSQIQSIDINSPEFKDLLVRLYQNINNISSALNIKDSAYYSQQEFINGQLFFPNPSFPSSATQSQQYRQVFRKVINFGALPNAGVKSVAHGITVNSRFSFTRIYATATNSTQTSFIPIPFASPVLNENIKLEVTNTNITITTAIDYSTYTTTYVIVEFLKL